MFDGQMLLQLWIGEQPRPVGSDVMNALVGVEVSVQDAGATGFQLTFVLGQSSALQTLFVLEGKQPVVFTRMVVGVVVRNQLQILVDGVVTNLQVTPGSGASAQLVVTGEDLTVLMGLLPRNGQGYGNQSIPVRVETILGRQEYRSWGIRGSVDASDMPKYVPNAGQDTPVQQGTDLDYVQGLARDCGQVFYLETASTLGESTAYWGPPFKSTTPQHALTVNRGPHTNVDSLNFRFDLKKNRPVQVRPSREVPADQTGPKVSPLDRQPLLGKYRPGLVEFGTNADTTVTTDRTASLPYAEALAIRVAENEVSANAEALEGSGSLNVLHYGYILKSHQLVEVRGASEIFDGTYRVKSVTHSIKRGDYKQSFQLSRNAFVASQDTVRV
jgi:hypothetical protein